MMSNKNLPPGCTNNMIDIAMGGGSSCAWCEKIFDDLCNEVDHPTNKFYLEIKSNHRGAISTEYLCKSCTKRLLKEILETL